MGPSVRWQTVDLARSRYGARVAPANASAGEPPPIHYELRFTSLSDRGRGYAFPCDALGRVDIDALSARGRANYLFARAVVGLELSAPIVSRVA
jgi:hypothetical protein